jgi:TPR repeat protein
VQKAQLLLGKICFEGQGVDPDYERAVLLLHAAAIRGSGEAYYELGRLFEQGEGEYRNEKEAIAYYTQALKYQHAAAAQRLEQLSASSPKSAEFAQSMEYMENLNSALKGNVLAQYNVGVFQYLGKGFAQPNYTEAAKWFTMAANQGYAKAQYNLGTLYENGEGVGKSLSQALKWYRLAAEQQDAPAQYALGTLYRDGQGVKKNAKLAREWLQRAAEQGHAPAKRPWHSSDTALT